MALFILIAFAFVLFILIFFIVRYVLFSRYIIDNFKSCNVIVVGKKGTGKDLLFSWVINKRKTFYYANIPYGGKYKLINPIDVSLGNNTYDNFIHGNIEKCKRLFYEKKDIYFSDGGTFFPSQYDSTLHKTYKSLPLYYALSRHTAEHNIHVNVQSLNRLWKALREQADFYIRCRGVIKLPFIIISFITTYDNYESCLNGLQPLSSRFFNQYSKANYDEYVAKYGTIKKGFLIHWKHKIKYDTRYFEKVVYGRKKRKYYK